MLRYLIQRTLGLVPTLLVIVSVSFLILRLAPGGPFDQEQGISPAVRSNLERAYGLNESLPRQYAHYLRALAHGDFGPSLRQRDFSVREADIRLSGGSTARVSADERISLRAGGGSHVLYRGDPSIDSEHLSGGSWIRNE